VEVAPASVFSSGGSERTDDETGSASPAIAALVFFRKSRRLICWTSLFSIIAFSHHFEIKYQP
jgi:hypothetical protein